ncbi:hydroxyethylthiazole kinase [Legionella geestiana]|uniref:Hydroxyethylthiazole kinase n=1 Tax=Legionella geestiana TaxID=45065 RepID=A0A0W0TQR8_9GAMM|nr:hydroxyethylthiazole kinase [Legionella geestiana]KTC97896.1 hydroxyethylthiazole kinase [Legionella geestiana]QBS11753.1 hydroxyethylthiazole kinase [Legionella geestiana]STX53556.1 hydroxyethylthiazole kinase [Legionella geestiana]
MMEFLAQSLEKMRAARPMVPCITNNVTMDFVANCLLAAGASPVMSNDARDVEELLHQSRVLYINTGTPDEAFMQLVQRCAGLSTSLQKTLVLDAPGAGATSFRTLLAEELLAHVNILRGNASEILALAGFDGRGRGVDSTASVEDAQKAAIHLAAARNCTVAISGASDFITDASHHQTLNRGTPLMASVTGMGCALGAMMAAFCAVTATHLEAATHASLFFGLAGELAARQAQGPGSFRVAFMDTLMAITPEILVNATHERII